MGVEVSEEGERPSDRGRRARGPVRLSPERTRRQVDDPAAPTALSRRDGRAEDYLSRREKS